MKRIRRNLPRLLAAAFVAAAAALWAPAAAGAQDAVVIDHLTVRVWPEFDRPSALVFYIAELGDDVALPADLRLGLPPDAEVNAVAYTDPSSGNLLMADYDIEGNAVSFSTPSPSLWIEFYDTALAVDGQRRDYALVLQMPYQVNDLVWEIQQPAGAMGFTLNVEGEQTLTTDESGLTTSVVQGGSLAAGQIVEMSFSYDKANDVLTADQLESTTADAGAAEQTAAPAQQSEGPSTLAIFALLVGGLALVGAGVWWYLQQNTGRRPAREGQRAASRGGKSGGAGGRFCTKCGASAEPGDRFCRNCGASLRG